MLRVTTDCLTSITAGGLVPHEPVRRLMARAALAILPFAEDGRVSGGKSGWLLWLEFESMLLAAAIATRDESRGRPT